jgi:hypothetical protein
MCDCPKERKYVVLRLRVDNMIKIHFVLRDIYNVKAYLSNGCISLIECRFSDSADNEFFLETNLVFACVVHRIVIARLLSWSVVFYHRCFL